MPQVYKALHISSSPLPISSTPIVSITQKNNLQKFFKLRLQKSSCINISPRLPAPTSQTSSSFLPSSFIHRRDRQTSQHPGQPQVVVTWSIDSYYHSRHPLSFQYSSIPKLDHTHQLQSHPPTSADGRPWTRLSSQHLYQSLPTQPIQTWRRPSHTLSTSALGQRHFTRKTFTMPDYYRNSSSSGSSRSSSSYSQKPRGSTYEPSRGSASGGHQSSSSSSGSKTRDVKVHNHSQRPKDTVVRRKESDSGYYH